MCCFSLNIAEAKNYKKSGFFTINDEDKLKYSKNFKVDDPLNKIILLFNHGQDHTDRKSKHCVHTNMMLSLSKLVRDNKILDKEMLLYSFCTDHFQGDSYRVDWYQKKELIPYKGQTKIDKRVEKWFDEPGHQIWQTDCFQYYDNTLIKYIEKKIK